MSYLQILAKCPLAKCPDTAPIPHQPSLKSTGLERCREPYKNHKNTNTVSTTSILLLKKYTNQLLYIFFFKHTKLDSPLTLTSLSSYIEIKFHVVHDRNAHKPKYTENKNSPTFYVFTTCTHNSITPLETLAKCTTILIIDITLALKHRLF